MKRLIYLNPHTKREYHFKIDFHKQYNMKNYV